MRSTATVSVDWTRLSDRGAWILRNVEVPIAFDRASYDAVAITAGIRKTRIRPLRHELREEVAQIVETD